MQHLTHQQHQLAVVQVAAVLTILAMETKVQVLELLVKEMLVVHKSLVTVPLQAVAVAVALVEQVAHLMVVRAHHHP